LDAQGFEKMESGINGRALDFAKFGRLFLHEGNLEGEQIIPASWVQESTSQDMILSDAYYPDWFRNSMPNGFYKYMWWGLARDGAADDFAALGNHGQFIYISPHKNLIIVRHGEKYGIDSFDWLHLFYEFASNMTLPDGEINHE
jgi:CubicO group peptidase (beta-lactamase class C family)